MPLPDQLLPLPVINLAELNRMAPVGEGSFGKIFMVQYRGQLFAEKRLKPEHISVERHLTEFQNEAMVMQALEHANIVKLIGVIVDQQAIILSIVMEYLTGGDLFDALDPDYSSYNSEQLQQIKHIVPRQIISALQYLHKLHIIYHDLKPENVLLDEDLNAKLTDFSLVSYTPNDQPVQMRCGSLEYMAPEVQLCQPHSYSADIFSLGVLLYVLYNQDIDILLSVQQAIQENFASLLANQSCPYRTVIPSLLASQPADRPTIDEVAQYFDSLTSSPFSNDSEENILMTLAI